MKKLLASSSSADGINRLVRQYFYNDRVEIDLGGKLFIGESLLGKKRYIEGFVVEHKPTKGNMRFKFYQCENTHDYQR